LCSGGGSQKNPRKKGKRNPEKSGRGGIGQGILSEGPWRKKKRSDPGETREGKNQSPCEPRKGGVRAKLEEQTTGESWTSYGPYAAT